MPPQLGYGIVAFADILGFRAMVEADVYSRPPIYLTKLLDALEELENELAGHDVDVTQFSDSIVLSAPFSPQHFVSTVATVRRLQQMLVARSISVRGGIAFGYHYADGGRMFSQALVKAYELESREARFPRILIDDNLLDAAINHKDMSGEGRAKLGEILMVDRDTRVFVNYLTEELFDSHRELVLQVTQTRTPSASVLEKAHWQADYHDFVASSSPVESEPLGPRDQARFAPYV